MYTDLPRGETRGCKSEVGVVEEHDSHVHRLWLEEDNKRVAFEIAVIIIIELDPRPTAVYFLGDNTRFSREEVVDFVNSGI